MSFFNEVTETGFTVVQSIIILALFLILLRFIIRNTKIYKSVLSFLFILGALPAAFFVEIGVNGCCGAPTTGNEGIGYMFGAILFFVGLGLLISLIDFKRLLNRKESNSSKLPSILLVAVVIVTISIPGYFIATTVIEDKSWQRKQRECANEVGYTHPGDDNSNRATAASQKAYRECLSR